jgi:hypothetical protein
VRHEGIQPGCRYHHLHYCPTSRGNGDRLVAHHVIDDGRRAAMVHKHARIVGAPCKRETFPWLNVLIVYVPGYLGRVEVNQISYFSILSPDELSRIATVTVERRFNRGDSILIEGEMGGALHYVTARVAKILLDQEESSEQGQRDHRLTQQEMAALAGSAREVVGRALKELETAGAIEMRQGHAVVLNQERLRILALG